MVKKKKVKFYTSVKWVGPDGKEVKLKLGRPTNLERARNKYLEEFIKNEDRILLNSLREKHE
jgi:hypothetical protein